VAYCNLLNTPQIQYHRIVTESCGLKDDQPIRLRVPLPLLPFHDRNELARQLRKGQVKDLQRRTEKGKKKLNRKSGADDFVLGVPEAPEPVKEKNIGRGT